MLARFTFSVIVSKYGEARWILSHNDQCRNVKTSALRYTLYIYIYIYYMYIYIYDIYI